MKKAASFLLAGILLFSLAACGSTDTDTDRNTGTSASVPETPELAAPGQEGADTGENGEKGSAGTGAQQRCRKILASYLYHS